MLPEESTQPAREPQIVSDDDWKERVKAEDAALDQKFREQAPAAGDRQSGSETAALPPADFATLISLFSTQALVALGALPNPLTSQSKLELPLAKHFIDLLGVLEEKTKGNLNEREQRLLDGTLHELRMAYVEQARKTG